MYKKIIRKAITTQLFLHSSSCIMGLFAWYVVSATRTQETHLTLPIYFDNLNNATIAAPETMHITLRAPRAYLQQSKKSGAVHINGTRLKPGSQLVHIKKEELLLPSAVSVVNYTPISVTLTTN